MKFAAIILIFLVSMQSYAAGVCDDPRTLNSLWNSKYSSYLKVPATAFTNSSPAFKVAQAFCFLENPGIQNFYDFFGYIFKFSAGPLLMNLYFDTNEYAHADTKTHEIILYQPFFDKTAGQLGPKAMEYKRASTLIHEARHIEMKENGWKNYEHVVCNKGDFKGVANCDEQFTTAWPTASPYSYEVMFFKALLDRSTLNLNRQDLQDWIDHLLKNSFNNVSRQLYEEYSSRPYEEYISGNE